MTRMLTIYFQDGGIQLPASEEDAFENVQIFTKVKIENKNFPQNVGIQLEGPHHHHKETVGDFNSLIFF